MGFQSSMVSANCCRIDDDRCSSQNQEESGWTVYFEDFMVNYRHDDSTTTAHDQVSFSDGSVESSYIISDAAATFSATWKHVGDGDNYDDCCRGLSSSIVKRSKRRRTFAPRVITDHDLEDTASSADQSSKPNGYFCEQASGNDQIPNKEAAFGHGNFLEIESYYKQQQQLLRKGLCLVPVSLLHNDIHHLVPLN